jgi:hypothetical protein
MNDGTSGRGYKAPPSEMLGPPCGTESKRNMNNRQKHWAKYPACAGAGTVHTLFGFGRQCYCCGRPV